MIDNLLNKIDVKNLRRFILILSISTFVISLTQNCYCLSIKGCEPAFAAFLFGFFGLFKGVVSWFANPFLIYSWIHIKDNERSTFLSLFSLFLASIFMFYKKIDLDEVVRYESGYWLWLLSICLMFFGNVLIGWKLKKENK